MGKPQGERVAFYKGLVVGFAAFYLWTLFVASFN